MANHKLYITDVYTNRTYKGKSVAVVKIDQEETEETMKNLAGELEQAETTFVRQLDKEIYEVRSFTPHKELAVSACASIASFWVLADQDFIEPLYKGEKEVLEISKSGRIQVFLDYDKYKIQGVRLILPYTEEARAQDLDGEGLDLLGLKEEDLGLGSRDLGPVEGLGIQGLNIPLRTHDLVKNLDYDKEALAAYLRDKPWGTLRVYSLEGEKILQKTLQIKEGVDEEKPLGLASASLLKYLYDLDLISGSQLEIIERHKENRLCRLQGQVLEETGGRVSLSGQAAISIEGVIRG
ncbi:MAG: PhzF family phenazine biosynthesis protein [Tissierellia bacterium]|nr:PhzF family phenazine biosynthesis protein [Tissierellia bacterium]